MLKKTYSISELAVQLQLPRTTINDWLKSFAPYLEFEMRGKRKEFNRNALEVLKNISAWKNEGKSATVIQKLLEEKYGILGEVTSGNNGESARETEKNTESNDSPGEMMQVVHSDIELLLANVEQFNEKRIKSYPAVKICRLGIDNSLRGKGIGSMLLDFIKYFFIENNKTGCRFLTVDAYNNAIPFFIFFLKFRLKEIPNIFLILHHLFSPVYFTGR